MELNFNVMPDWKKDSFEILMRIPEWAIAFQVTTEAIERQIPIAYQWTRANKNKAPKKNVMRFLFNWLAIAQRKGSLTAKPAPLYKEKRPTQEEMLTYEDIQAMKK